jgi:hypothetical protein
MARYAAAVLLAVVFGLSGSSTADARQLTRCRDVVIRTGDGSVYTRTRGLWARGVGCPVARAVAHTMLSYEGSAEAPPNPHGFRCDVGSDGVSCKRGSDWVTWGYYVDREFSGRWDHPDPGVRWLR